MVNFKDKLRTLEPWLGHSATNGDDLEAKDEHDEPSFGWTDKEAKHGRYSISECEL